MIKIDTVTCDSNTCSLYLYLSIKRRYYVLCCQCQQDSQYEIFFFSQPNRKQRYFQVVVVL